MKRSALMGMVALGLTAAATSASARFDYVYGPAPDFEDYKRLGTAAVRQLLPNPDDWLVEWPNGYIQGGWVRGGKSYGYLTCGTVRAIKPTDQGFPSYPFAAVIDYGVVKRIEFQPKPRNSAVNIVCPKMVSAGNLPPASLMPGATSKAIPLLGLTINPMPEGAYVAATAPGSPAAAAGLQAGMVITRVNGISLAQMGPAMSSVFASDAPELAIDTADGGHLRLKRDER